MRELRLFGHYISLPLIILSLLDATAIASSFSLMGGDATGKARGALLVLAPLTAITLVGAKAAVGLYHFQLRSNMAGIASRLTVAFALALPVIVAAGLLLPLNARQLVTLVAAGAVAYGVVGLFHAGFFALADAGALRRRVLVLGAGDSAIALSRFRRRADRRGFEIIGYVPMEEVHHSALPLLRPEHSLCRFARENGIEEIVVALEERRSVVPLNELVECRFSGIAVTDLAAFIEREAGKVPLGLLRPGWLVFDGNRVGRGQEFLRRLFDLVVATLLLLLALPIIIVTMIAIKREDGRLAPIFYRQTRVGKEGRHFELLKFRSMRVDAEADGRARWASRGDDRITRVGQIIRKARIDELPQLWNVLRGEMSLVGPRPERPEFVAELEQHIPYYGERHRIKPGVSGWAQILYPYGSSRNDAAEKLQYDLYYLKNRSLMLDLIIILQTVEVVLFGKGAR